MTQSFLKMGLCCFSAHFSQSRSFIGHFTSGWAPSSLCQACVLSLWLPYSSSSLGLEIVPISLPSSARCACDSLWTREGFGAKARVRWLSSLLQKLILQPREHVLPPLSSLHPASLRLGEVMWSLARIDLIDLAKWKEHVKATKNQLKLA